MGNLIKYEFRKTWFLKGIILVITSIFEVIFLLGLGAKNDDWLGFGVIFLTLSAIFGVFIIGVFGIYTLSKDLNTKRSYMLFMTPNNSYKILGAKLIENGSSIILSGLFFLLLAFADMSALAAYKGKSGTFINVLSQLFGFDTLDIVMFILSGLETLSGWIYIVVVGFFAIVVSATFLNGRKFNGLISFIIFLIISIFFSRIHSKVIIETYGTIFDYSAGRIAFGIVFYLMLSTLLYFISAWMMDNKLSV